MSIFFICSIACITRCDFSRSGSVSSSGRRARDDLPREAEPVSQPAAHALLAALGERVPVPVDLVLRRAVDDERDGLRERVRRPAVQRDEPLPVELEADRHHGAFGARPGGAVAGHVQDPRVREQRRVERRRLLGLGVVPEKRRDRAHRQLPFSRIRIATEPVCRVSARLNAARVGGVREQALALAEQHREDHQVELVDEAAREQRLHERRAAGHEDVAGEPLLQRADLLREVAAEHGRVVPLRVLQRGGDDELRHRVELLAEVAGALHRRPRLREAVVGDAAEQLRVGGHQLVVLEPVALLAALEAERPAAAVERLLLRSAGILHHAVERQELRDHELAHGSSRRVCRVKTVPVGTHPAHR